MIYIFEDNKESSISKLFLKGYSDSITDIRFSNGSGNIEYELRKAVRDIKENDYIAIFIDLIPDNQNTVFTYKSIIYIANKLNANIIVVPIVCAEYYFIKSIYNTKLALDNEAISRCISREPHKNDELILKKHSNKAKKSFEKYCKFIRDNATQGCVRQENIPTIMKSIKLEYFNENCKNNKIDSFCEDIPLEEKAKRLLKQYPLIPSNCLINGVEKIGLEKATSIIESLLIEYNTIVDKYKKAYPNDADSFLEV